MKTISEFQSLKKVSNGTLSLTNHTAQRRSAFTLVELLVVISIIALLVSILMPSLSRAREHAKRVVCLTNLRSIGTVEFLYLADNNSEFIRFGVTWKPYSHSFKTLETLSELGGMGWESEVFSCPSAYGKPWQQGPVTLNWEPWIVLAPETATDPGTIMTNFSRFAGFIPADGAGNPYDVAYEWESGRRYDGPFVKESSVKWPSETPLMTDWNDGASIPFEDGGAGCCNHKYVSQWYPFGVGDLYEGQNNVYMDLHGEWVEHANITNHVILGGGVGQRW